MLRDFYYSDDRRLDSAILALEEAAGMTVSYGVLIHRFSTHINPKDPAARVTSVKASQKFFSEDKDRAFEAKVWMKSK